MALELQVSAKTKTVMSLSQIHYLKILSMSSDELSSFLQDEYLENPVMDYTGGHVNTNDDETEPDIPYSSDNAVKRYLLEQLPMNIYSSDEFVLFSYLIDCLDSSGFFTDELKDSVLQELDIDPEQLENALRILKSLSPCGVFSADLRECLLRQLEVSGQKDSLAWQLVSDYLPYVAEGKITSLSKILRRPASEIRAGMEQIMQLNPRPLNGLEDEVTDSVFIVPDIILFQEDGELKIALNDNWIEDYRVNDYYVNVLNHTQDEDLKTYLNEKLEHVKFIMNGIKQRRKTLITIADFILKYQIDFFRNNHALKPMTMVFVADELGINVSTVSRAVREKYMLCPDGIIPMKKFFSPSVAKSTFQSEAGVGSMEVKSIIRELILREDKSNPLSDQQIVKALSERNINLSRRVIAKYRSELGFKTSYDRREL